MKIPCKVSVFNRQLYINGQRLNTSRNKHVNGTIALCSKPKSEEYFIILFTAQDKNGTKYTVKRNITKILTRYISDGKATLQFLEPPHDILLQADSIQLKSFLRILKDVLEGKLPRKELLSCSMSVVPIPAKDTPPKKMVVKCRSQFPSKGFPRTLETLHINDVCYSRLSTSILLLMRLRVLDISNNCLEYLPEELNKLPNLRELNVSSNSLHKGRPQSWKWMGGNLSRTLVCLNLSSNNLAYLPDDIVKLYSLEYLNIHNNEILRLPTGVGGLRMLKVFICSNNRIGVFPGSIKNWRLQMLNISNNAFEPRASHEFPDVKSFQSKFSLWTLKEYTARKVLSYRLPYSSESLPVTLVTLLDHAKYCVCGEACFSVFLRQPLMFLLPSITNDLVVSPHENGYVPIDCYFCSMECYNSYKRRYRGHIIR